MDGYDLLRTISLAPSGLAHSSIPDNHYDFYTSQHKEGMATQAPWYGAEVKGSLPPIDLQRQGQGSPGS